MIILDKISRYYDKKDASLTVKALDDISLCLPERGFVAILGASGSGKTTLLNVIGGLDTPTSGRMIVDDISTENFSSKDWDSYRNEKIGFVLQNCYLLNHLNIRDNIAVKLQISNYPKEEIDSLVDDALKQVDLLDKKFESPKALSGGQKQRVAIARAIINKPTVILADEPTGALDSKTGTQIMELLKELSKDHLVVIVTHNKDYAIKYAERVIELQDGKIVSDSSELKLNPIISDKKMKKVSIPFFTSLKWAFKNLIVRKGATISIVVASALGLAGVGLILSISSGVTTAFIKSEGEALSKYPVQISSYSKQSFDGSKSTYPKFPDDEEVIGDLTDFYKQEHFNYMSDRFLSYMDEMPKNHYYVKYESSLTAFNIFTKVNDTSYKKITSTSSYFYKGVDNEDFVKSEYDCLKGKYPTEANEIALVVDAYNRVSGSNLESLGFDIDTSYPHKVRYSFDDILNKTYRYVANDDYYDRSSSGIYSKKDKSNKQFYDDSTYELRIVGILREKDDQNSLYKNGIVYTQAFTNMVVDNAKNSKIVKEQNELGLEKNVLTGLPYEDVKSGSTTYSKEYVFESVQYQIGSFSRITTLYYFTKDVDSRNKINDYFKSYLPSETIDFGDLSIYDYISHATVQFDGAIKLMTGVLYVFAAISIIVSAILNAILTYISIHQRTGEIGLLRSLGARKVDIALMVETESFMSGLVGGMLSILLSLALVKPVELLITQAIYQYNFYLLSDTTFDLGGFKWWVAPILIGLGLITALISSFIPSIIASRKDPAHAINE